MIKFKKFLTMIDKIRNGIKQSQQSGQKVIGVFGWTRVGKSTTINILMGQKAIVNEKGQLEIENTEEAFAATGHSINYSCTLTPELITGGKGGYAFFDTAGLLDKREPGNETESAVASCGLPILLQESSVHAIALVISKTFLEGEGNLSFDKFMETLTSFIDFKTIRTKLFFLMTKTIDYGTLQTIDSAITLMPDGLAKIQLQNLKRQMLTNGANGTREKLAERKMVLNDRKLIDERKKYGNVFIIRGDQDDDVQSLWDRLTSCMLIRSSFCPTIDNLDSFLIPASAAYIRWKNQLFYITKFERTCDVLLLPPQTLKEFDRTITQSLHEDGIRHLTEIELKKISSWTGHIHLDAVMRPIPQKAFPLNVPRTYQSQFTDLYARVETISVDTTLPQITELLAFKSALLDMIREFNLLVSLSIHLPDTQILCGEYIEKAVLNILVFYAKNDLRDFPNCLRQLTSHLEECRALLLQHFEEITELSDFLQLLTTKLTTLCSLPTIVSSLSDALQVTACNSAIERIDTLSVDRATALTNIFNHATTDTECLYWYQLLSSYTTIPTILSDQFRKQAIRDASLKSTLTKCAQLTTTEADDALIGLLLNTMLALKEHYTHNLNTPLPLTVFPFVENIPLVYRCIQALIQSIAVPSNQDFDPHAVMLTKLQAAVSNMTTSLDNAVTQSDTLINLLLTDYYQCLNDINEMQNEYVNNYRNTNARHINVLQTPDAFISQYQNGNVAATLHVQGGGTLNAIVNGKIDKSLLAAEALGLDSFTLGQPTISYGVNEVELILEERNFSQKMIEKVETSQLENLNDGFKRFGGCILGSEFFPNTRAEWQRTITLNVFGQSVYQVTTHKIYEHFKVKAAFYEYWYKEEMRQWDHDDRPSSPGNYLIDFSAYGRSRREPYLIWCYQRGECDWYYTDRRNTGYDDETATLKRRIYQAAKDYVDIQLTSATNAPAWSYKNQAVGLTSLPAASEVTLTNTSIVTHAGTQINNWFTNHRTALVTDFSNNSANSSMAASQDKLDTRKTNLLNLDIQVALIKLLGKLFGKAMSSSFFTTLITGDTIETEVRQITNLAVTDLTPTLTATLCARRLTANDFHTCSDDYNTRHLHPRTILPLLKDKIAIMLAWRQVKESAFKFETIKPDPKIDMVHYFRKLPSGCASIEIQHRDLSHSTFQTCLVIAVRNHSSHLRTLRLRDCCIKNIGSLLQNSTSLHELDLSHNPLSTVALNDIVIYLSRNPALNALNISANPKTDQILMDQEVALNLIAALYLNRNLTTINVDNLVFSDPLIPSAIECIILCKQNIVDNANAIKDEDYFAILDAQLNAFLSANKHPIVELDKEVMLFRTSISDRSLLRSRISNLKMLTPTPHNPHPHTSSALVLPIWYSSAERRTLKFFHSNPKFLLMPRSLAQNGWNCFDIAVGIQRQQLINYALEHADDPTYVHLLAPEIRHAAAITATIMNDPSHGDDSYALPKCMRNRRLQDIVNNAFNALADPIFRSAFSACCTSIGHVEGRLPTLSQLLEFFANQNNRQLHAQQYQIFIDVYNRIILPHETAFNNYSSDKETYKQYIKEYYKNGWVSFQADNSSSMIDIAALMLNSRIIVHTPEQTPGNWREIYRTQNQASREVHIQFAGNHFIALVLNPSYVSSNAPEAESHAYTINAKAKRNLALS